MYCSLGSITIVQYVHNIYEYLQESKEKSLDYTNDANFPAVPNSANLDESNAMVKYTTCNVLFTRLY